MPRSIAASQSGIQQVKAALPCSQENFAIKIGISPQTLKTFFKGEAIDREKFTKICKGVELDWQLIVDKPSAQEVDSTTDIDYLVRQLREASAESLRKRCGTMRILDMTQPIDSGAIYTDVNILERVAGKTRREITEMMVDCGAEGFDRFFLGNVKQQRVPGLDAVLDKQQLMILGRPGAGKTTFLKRLAIECLNGNFLADRLPIFVTLKEFAETEGKPGILDFMGSNQTALTQILDAGKALVLLDGLDEVMEQDHDRATTPIGLGRILV
jgi:predicted NACHT family NTPase